MVRLTGYRYVSVLVSVSVYYCIPVVVYQVVSWFCIIMKRLNDNFVLL